MSNEISIFLSHSHKDVDKVRKIRDILETLNCELLQISPSDTQQFTPFVTRLLISVSAAA